jgi:hypothetical protein
VKHDAEASSVEPAQDPCTITRCLLQVLTKEVKPASVKCHEGTAVFRKVSRRYCSTAVCCTVTKVLQYCCMPHCHEGTAVVLYTVKFVEGDTLRLYTVKFYEGTSVYHKVSGRYCGVP